MLEPNVFPDQYGHIDLSGTFEADRIICPNHVKGSVYLHCLVSVNTLVLPKKIGGDLLLGSLKHFKKLVLPKKIVYGLFLQSLDARNLVLPKYVGADVDLNGLTGVEGIVFPTEVQGNLLLRGLTQVDELVLPKYIGHFLDLTNLKEVNRIVLPKRVDGQLLGDFLFKEGKIIYHMTYGYPKVFRIPTSKEDMATWLEETKNVYIPKGLLIEILSKLYTKEEALSLVDSILLGKILTTC
jgi:hypothetical protein